MSAKKSVGSHPLYIDMITTAITEIKDRKGASKQAIMKYIRENYEVGDNASSVVKMTLKRNLDSGKLIQAAGVGAAGRFRVPSAAGTKKKSTPAKPVVSKKKVTPKKKAVLKTRTPAKKASAKKPASKKKSPPKKAKGTKRSRR